MRKLYSDTPLAGAIFEILDDLTNLAEEKHGKLSNGSIRAFIFGGCAVHLYTNARGSNDLDVELEALKSLNIHELIVEVEDADYEDDTGAYRTLTLDNTFNPAIPDLHPDWREDSHAIQVGEHVLHIYLVSPVDIAVSKLGRCTSDDISDMIALYSQNYFTIEQFSARAQEALDYSPTPDRLQSNIDFAIKQLRELAQ